VNADGAVENHRLSSLQRKAKTAGLFYLLTFLVGGVAEFASGRLVVTGDAATTAHNILARQGTFWLGFAAYLIVLACYIAVTALFYDLFKPVSASLSLLAAFFSLVGCAIQAAAIFFYVAPWTLLQSPNYLAAFRADQLQVVAFASLELYAQAYSAGFVFFGFYCLLIGYLILQSTFLPRGLGVFMTLAGCGWLTFLSPPLANSLWPYVAVPGVAGEGALTLWLLLRGVDIRKWNEKANAQKA
jgi:Domain of unknown function (DUF4386)